MKRSVRKRIGKMRRRVLVLRKNFLSEYNLLKNIIEGK
jgi:hypothetical protein